MKANTEATFWGRVDERGPDECWPWTARCNADGYGKFDMRGEFSAHRLSWMFTNGEIPEGMQVLHRCDNPPCCNPAHLFLGTHDDNMADRDAKRRLPYGEERPRSQLTNEQAKYARHLFFAERHSQKDLAEFFDCSKWVIQHLTAGRTYRSEKCRPAI